MPLSLMFAGFALIHVFLLFQSFKYFNTLDTRVFFLRAMLCALIYDNTALALGNIAHSGGWLDPLTQGRYLLHSAVLPFLTIFALLSMRAANVPLGSNTIFSGFAYLFTAGALGYGLYHEVILLELELAENFGHYRMASTSTIPPLATIFTNIFAIIMGALIWKAKGPKWLFVGSLAIFIINGATATSPYGFILGNIAEVIFVVFLLKQERAIRSA